MVRDKWSSDVLGLTKLWVETVGPKPYACSSKVVNGRLLSSEALVLFPALYAQE